MPVSPASIQRLGRQLIYTLHESKPEDLPGQPPKRRAVRDPHVLLELLGGVNDTTALGTQEQAKGPFPTVFQTGL